MAITALESRLNAAGVAAVFPVGIAIGSERLPAVGAGEIVERLFTHRVLVRIPPVDAAGIRAELGPFSPGDLR